MNQNASSVDKAESHTSTSKTDSTQSPAPHVSKRAVLPWIGAFLKPYRTKVITAIIFLFIGSLAWLSLGQGVRLMVDEGFLKDNGSRLNEIILLVIGITALSSSAIFCRFYLMTWLGERVSADIRLKVYDHLLKLSPGFYAKLRTGEVISRFTADSTLLQSVVGSSLSMMLRASVTVIGGIVMMAITSLKMTGLVLLAVPMVLGPIFFFGRKVRDLSRKSQDKVGDLGAYVDETLHEIHTVQAYSHEDQDRALFNHRVEAVMDAARGRIKYRSILISLVMFLSILAIALVTWVGAHDVMNGAISAGELSAFMFYAVMVAGSVATISEVIGEIQRAAGATERLIELIETPIDIPVVDSPLELVTPVRGELELKQVRFSYSNMSQNGNQPDSTDTNSLELEKSLEQVNSPELENSLERVNSLERIDESSSPERVPYISSEDEVIRGLNIHIKPGERVALVGASGAGKSTLFELLQRFYVLNSGSIELDGVDIAKLTPQTLRQQYALVPQESVIFATSVLENVRYGRIDASEEAVKQACIAAKADEFIREFPDGYQTYLGERGVRLSGGQKQRIAIARAILADRPILLLDEATSALDAVSEHKVKLALDSLMAGKTTLIIAHRLATVINVDRILVLNKGQVVASGTHSELMQSSELYQEFASLQLLTDDS